MADITNLSNEISGLVSDQSAFNAKVDSDLAAIQAEIASLQSQVGGPTQAQLDALQASVASVRAGLASEQSKIDAATPVAAPVTPAV